MSMRVPFLVSLLVSTVLAGCLTGDDEPEPTLPPAGPYTRFLCPDQTLHPAAPGDENRCNVRITGRLPRNNGPANELTVAVDPTNPLRLTAGGKDYTLGAYEPCGKTRVWSGYYWSDDGGFTWFNDLFKGHDQPASGQASGGATYGYHCISDPVVYWDAKGNAYYSGLSYNFTGGATPPVQQQQVGGGAGNSIWIAKSTDGGRTYGPAKIVAQGTGDGGVFHDKQWFTIDYNTGNLYFTWSAFSTQPTTLPDTPATPTANRYIQTDQILFSRSTDGGETWSSPRALYESQPAQATAVPQPELEKQFSMPQVDTDGRIHVTWRTDVGKAIWYTSSDDQGATWTPAKKIVQNLLFPCPDGSQCPPTNSNFRYDASPVLAVDRSNGPNRGHLYVVWASNVTSPAMNTEIFLSKSADRGVTWATPVRVNDDNGTNDQFLPWIDIGPQGDVHIVYYDRRYDSANTLLDLTYVHSLDGVSFDSSLRVTEESIDARFSLHQSGREFIGDYIGVMEGTNGWVHPIWVDTRNGRADAFTTVIVRSP